MGRILSFRLVTDRESGKPKGYGFCEYADGTTALSAMRNLNGYECGGRNIRVDFADGGNSADSTLNGGQKVIECIDNAMATLGPYSICEMLTEFQIFAKENKQHAKMIFQAYPALAHAILAGFTVLEMDIAKEDGAPKVRWKGVLN